MTLAIGSVVIVADAESQYSDATAESLSAGTVGESYSVSLGDASEESWYGVSSGSLPPGLSFNSNTGVISGKPISSGNYAFSIKVMHTSTEEEETIDYSILVNSAPITYVSGISMSQSSASMDKDDSVTLHATLSPSGGVYTSVSWLSSDTSVATISESGLTCTVTGTGAGTSTVTAIVSVPDNGASYNAYCNVIVTDTSGGTIISDYSGSLSDYEYTYCIATKVATTSTPADTFSLYDQGDDNALGYFEIIRGAYNQGKLTVCSDWAPSWFTVDVTSSSVIFTIAYGAVCDGTYFHVFDCGSLGTYVICANITVTDSGSVTPTDFNSFTITFESNGGSYVPPISISNKSTTYTYDIAGITSSKDGYTFVGWCDNSACAAVLISTAITMDAGDTVTLYAVWEEGEASLWNQIVDYITSWFYGLDSNMQFIVAGIAVIFFIWLVKVISK